MGFDLDCLLGEIGDDKADFRVIEFCIRMLTDVYFPEVKKYIPSEESSLCHDVGSLIDILNVYCVLIETRHSRQKEPNGGKEKDCE